MTRVLRPHLLEGASLEQVEHLGLALAQYLPTREQGGQEKAKDLLLTAIAGDGQHRGTFSQGFKPRGYEEYYRRFLHAAQHAGPGRILTLESRGRSLVGLGLETPLENSLATHHTYGVPVLSGSAMKGLTSSFARKRYEGWQPEEPASPHRRLFGYAPSPGHQKAQTELGAAGLITFHDALPQPGKWQIHREVMTTHHSGYYMKEKGAPPADWDEPVPVPFLSASGTFTLVLHAAAQPDTEAALDAATQLLTAALMEEGIGAKTTSGYGRFEVTDVAVLTGASPSGATLGAGPASGSANPPLPEWIQVVLKAKWSLGELRQPGGKLQNTVRRMLEEHQKGGLDRATAQAAAREFMGLFERIEPKERRKYSWYAELNALATAG